LLFCFTDALPQAALLGGNVRICYVSH